MNIPAYYYAQQGADYSLPQPALGFRGWQETEVPVDPDHTAILVMHAWKTPDTEGLRQHVEYLKRADKIMEERFPSFLQAVRQSGVRLIHVVAGFETALDKLPGYHRVTQEIIEKALFAEATAPQDMTWGEPDRFHAGSGYIIVG